MAEDMGVTGNAVLLLGYIGGLVSSPASDRPYDVSNVDAARGEVTVRHQRSGNLYRVSVVQIEGTQ